MSEPTGDTPRTSDDLQVQVDRRPPPDDEAGRLLDELLVAMHAAGEDAQQVYDEALERARGIADDIVAALARAEESCDPRDYARRWALVHLAGELRHQGALRFLERVVMTPIPAEESPDPHAFSTATEETILRTTAVQGLERLATEGSDVAVEVLFAALDQPSLSVRRAAVQGLLASPRGDELRERIVEVLPEEQRFLLDLRRVGVREVPQVADPRVHLAEGAGEDTGPPAPRLPEDSGRADGAGRGEPPTTRS